MYVNGWGLLGGRFVVAGEGLECGQDDRGKLELTLDVDAEMRKLCWPCENGLLKKRQACRFRRRRIRLRGC